MQLEPGELQYAAKWFINRLIPDKADRIDLSVYVRRMKDDYGRCWHYENQPMKFDIIIDAGLSTTMTIRTLAHEATHVAQYASGKMKTLWNKKKKVLWKRTKIYDEKFEGEAYRNSPWEKEAKAMEIRLMKAYVRHRTRSSS